MKINLLKCFPHRFTKHYDRKSGKTFAICLRCSKSWETEADYRTPKMKWYDFIDRIEEVLCH
jgi:hypothetical protein